MNLRGGESCKHFEKSLFSDDERLGFYSRLPNNRSDETIVYSSAPNNRADPNKRAERKS